MSTTPPVDQQPLLGTTSRGSAISISSEIMVTAIIFFFVVVVFVFFLHIYARMRWGRMASASRRSRLVFAANLQDPLAATRRGLHPSLLASLPVCVYRSEDFKADAGLECAVCLSELADGEKARILPNCNHGFHLDCIDMWFHSHSTCPLCRRPVDGDLEAPGATGAEASPPTEVDLATDLAAGSPNLPTNVLFWGTQDRVSTVAGSQLEDDDAAAAPAAATGAASSSFPGGNKSDGAALVIEIPRRAAVEFSFSSPHSPLPSSKFPSEDLKSPAAMASQTPTRLRALRRILSREKRVAGPSCSPRGAGDIEQGMMGGVDGGSVPRTPTSS